ncbi:MAG: glycosyltransferase family 39 protein [Phycisphaerae bacterium]|nr:glycosyltransferase family 39 protein [Phycisphaerae bacterium]
MRPRTMDWIRPALYVALFSVALRLVWAALATVTPISDFNTYDSLGWKWLTEGELGVGTNAARATPGFPAYLAVIYWAFGHSWKAVGLVNAAFCGITSGLLVLLAAQMVSTRASVIAGLLHAVSPTALAYVPVIASENLGVFLLVASLLMLALSHRQTGIRQCVLAALAGILCAALILTRPACLFMAPPMLLLSIYNPVRKRWAIGAPVAFVVAMAATFAPWSIRNYSIGLSPLTITTHGGHSLYLWLNDHNPDTGRGRIAPLPGGLSEQQRDRVARAMAFRWMRDNPGNYLRIVRTQATRLLGTRVDWWAASFLVPTRDNDHAVTQVYRGSRGGEPVPPSLAKKHKATLASHGAFLQRYRIGLAPLTLVALLLALLRLRTYALVVLPALSYLGGVSLTICMERYRILSNPLLFVPLAALLSDMLFGTRDLGRWPRQGLKLAVAIVAVFASIILHVTGVTASWYDYPTAYATAPDVSHLKFTRVDLTKPPAAYESRWQYRTVTTIERDGSALHCRVRGTSDTSRTQYGGLKFPVDGLRALRLGLNLHEQENIHRVFVEGYDASGERVVGWHWDIALHGPVPDCPTGYVFVPGAGVGYFEVSGSDLAEDVREVHVFLQINPLTSAGFDIRRAEFAGGENLVEKDGGQ